MTLPLESTIYRLTGRTASCSVPRYPQPDSVPLYRVCPSCKTEVFERSVTGESGETHSYQCRRCGEVLPIRSAVRNAARAIEEVAAPCGYCGHPEVAHFVGCPRPPSTIAGLLGFPFAPGLAH